MMSVFSVIKLALGRLRPKTIFAIPTLLFIFVAMTIVFGRDILNPSSDQASWVALGMKKNGDIQVDRPASQVGDRRIGEEKSVSLSTDRLVELLTNSIWIEQWHFESDLEDEKFGRYRGDSDLSVARVSHLRFHKQMRLLDETIQFFKSLKPPNDIDSKASDLLHDLTQTARAFQESSNDESTLTKANLLIKQLVIGAFKGAGAQPLRLEIKSQNTRPYLVLRSLFNPVPPIKFLPVNPNDPGMGRIELGSTGITQEQWFLLMGTNPSFFDRRQNCPGEYLESFGVPRCPTWPVDSVSEQNRNEYISRLNREDQEYNYRLPYAHERESAAKAGLVTMTLDSDKDLDRSAWMLSNANLQTHAVGTKLPNRYGFYDLQGNLWEVVTINSETPEEKTYTVTGGSWLHEKFSLRIGNLQQVPRDWICYDVGFRLARYKKRNSVL